MPDTRPRWLVVGIRPDGSEYETHQVSRGETLEEAQEGIKKIAKHLLPRNYRLIPAPWEKDYER